MFQDKQDIYIRIIIFTMVSLFIIALFNTILSYKELGIERSKLEILKIDIKIKKENFLGDLLFQYHFDLQDCIDSIATNPKLSEEKCIEGINQSNLAQKIKEWGGEEYLKVVNEENK